ncbi:hypothetical protein YASMINEVIRUS_1276 [Yasminevirus sp. GU-2018]|uniref:Uncharacterized protein n=1 Tax=Yasminevirus sp. GU-2018 TaxID=2420051 RepID=A0A5K0UB65_9VIRU|nr:hypothetical protein YASMINEVIRUS_1276 [Yasminevirus sp. GU-2018]
MFFVKSSQTSKNAINVTFAETRSQGSALLKTDRIVGTVAQFIKSENKLDVAQSMSDDDADDSANFSVTSHTTYSAFLYENQKIGDTILVVYTGYGVELWVLSSHSIVTVPTASDEEGSYATLTSIENTRYGFDMVFSYDSKLLYKKCVNVDVLLGRSQVSSSVTNTSNGLLFKTETYPWFDQDTKNWAEAEVPFVLVNNPEDFDKFSLCASGNLQGTAIIGICAEGVQDVHHSQDACPVDPDVINGNIDNTDDTFDEDCEVVHSPKLVATVRKFPGCAWVITYREFKGFLLRLKNYSCIVVNHTFQPKITVKDIGVFDVPIKNAERAKITSIKVSPFDDDTFEISQHDMPFSSHTVALADLVKQKQFEKNVVKNIKGHWINGKFYRIRVMSNSFVPGTLESDIKKLERNIFNSNTHSCFNSIGFMYPATNTLSLWSSDSVWGFGPIVNNTYPCSMVGDDCLIACCDHPDEETKKALFCFRNGTANVFQTVHRLGDDFVKVDFTDTNVIIHTRVRSTDNSGEKLKKVETINKRTLFDREVESFMRNHLIDVVDLNEPIKIGSGSRKKYVVLVWGTEIADEDKTFEKIFTVASHLGSMYPNREFVHLKTKTHEVWFYDQDQNRRCPDNACDRAYYLSVPNHPLVKSVILVGSFWIHGVITTKCDTQRKFDIFTSYYTKSIMNNELIDLNEEKTKEKTDEEDDFISLDLAGVDFTDGELHISLLKDGRSRFEESEEKPKTFLCRIKLASIVQRG